MPPVLTAPSVEDTTLPGATRRRAWFAPAVRSHAAVVLTANRLYLAPLSWSPTPDVHSALAAGADPGEVFGPGTIVVELIDVRRVRNELLGNAVGVEALGEQITVTFAAAEAADEMYAALWRRLGDGVVLAPHHPPLASAAREPVGVMLGLLFSTAVLAVVAALAGDVPAAAVPLPDWRWVCGAGGAALAVAQVWLYRRLTRPPVRLELVRR